MILIDSSVLTGYLRGDDTDAVRRFDQVIERRLPFGISPIIFTEVLQGAASEKEFDLLAEYLGGQRFYELAPGSASYYSAAKMFFDLRRKGLTIRSTIDCLIAQTAIDNDLYLLHDDADFDRLAGHIPLKIWT